MLQMYRLVTTSRAIVAFMVDEVSFSNGFSKVLSQALIFCSTVYNVECLSKRGDLGQPHRSSDKKVLSCSSGLGLDTWVLTCSIIRMSCLPILDC